MTGPSAPARLAEIDAAAAEVGLTALGAASIEPHERLDADGAADPAMAGLVSVVLLGPKPGAFWPIVSAAPELRDGARDPIDRWSRRVGAALAERLGGLALFPFGGPPYRPFLPWARRTGRIWASPIGLLVGADHGLFVSFRLGLGFAEEISAPPAAKPCDRCADTPCRSACPVDAFAGGAYDVAACRAHVAAPEGADCRLNGCLARRACPAAARALPPPEQAALHMRAFLGVDAGGA